MTLRRSLASVLFALLALVAGVGSFTAAAAFPSSHIELSVTTPSAPHSCCDEQRALTHSQCGAQICHALVPRLLEAPAQFEVAEMHPAEVIQSLLGLGFRPEPPPPRHIGREPNDTDYMETER